MRLLSGFAAVAVLSASFAFAGIQPVSAQIFDDVCKRTPSATVCKDQAKNQTKADNVIYGRNGIIMKATNLLALVVGIVATIVVAVGGLRYIFSSGDAGSIATAKRSIIYALVAIVVALAGRSIITFVINRL
jgi:hypothetical protein